MHACTAGNGEQRLACGDASEAFSVGVVEASAPQFEVLGNVAVEAAGGALIAGEWRGGAVDFRTGESYAVMVQEYSSAVCLFVGLEVFSIAAAISTQRQRAEKSADIDLPIVAASPNGDSTAESTKGTAPKCEPAPFTAKLSCAAISLHRTNG